MSIEHGHEQNDQGWGQMTSYLAEEKLYIIWQRSDIIHGNGKYACKLKYKDTAYLFNNFTILTPYSVKMCKTQHTCFADMRWKIVYHKLHEVKENYNFSTYAKIIMHIRLTTFFVYSGNASPRSLTSWLPICNWILLFWVSIYTVINT